MGLGCVLLFWIILSLALAAMAAAAVGGVVYVIERRRGGAVRGMRVLAAAALPFISIAYMWAAFGAYAVWCETVRGVDLGMGDTWRVPLTGGYSLVAIDTFDQSFVSASDGRQSHVELKRIGTRGPLIAGEDPGGFFLLDAQRGTDARMASAGELERRVSAAGAPAIDLVTPEDFYDAHRATPLDALAGLLIVGPPILLVAVFARRLTRR